MSGTWVTASSDVAPAGGWTVFVRAMSDVVMAHASGPPISGRFFAVGFKANSLAMATPITLAMIWLTTALRGCANGDSIAQNSSTAAAPWDEVRMHVRRRTCVGYLQNWQ